MAGDGNGRLIAGRYRLLGAVGRGGMGVVWRARDEVLGREVAVKEILSPPGLDERERQVMNRRAIREARSAARLSHPNVVTVFDVVEEEGRPWVVMEFVAARSLQEVVEQDGPLTPARAAGIGRQVLLALDAAHDEGILHRDVKPGNVLLADGDRVVLTDFGIAVIEGESTLTQSGGILGSPAYVSPERIRGERATPAGDLWGLGVTLYAAMEGRPPFHRTDPVAVFGAVLVEEPGPPEHAGPLLPVIQGLLHKDPEARMTSRTALDLLTRAQTPVAVAAGPAPADPNLTIVDPPFTTSPPAPAPTAAFAPAPGPGGGLSGRAPVPTAAFAGGPEPGADGDGLFGIAGLFAYAGAGVMACAVVLIFVLSGFSRAELAGAEQAYLLVTAACLGSLAVAHLPVALALGSAPPEGRRGLGTAVLVTGLLGAGALPAALVTFAATVEGGTPPWTGWLWAITGIWIGLTGLLVAPRSRTVALAGETAAGGWILLLGTPSLAPAPLLAVLVLVLATYGCWAVGMGRLLRSR